MKKFFTLASLASVALLAAACSNSNKNAIVPDPTAAVEEAVETVGTVGDSVIAVGEDVVETVTPTNAKSLSADVLPAPAQKILADYFKGADIVAIEVDNNGSAPSDYEVALANGVKIEFNAAGAVEDIDCRAIGSVPQALVPKAIRDYVATNYANQKVVKIDTDKKGYDVDLSSGVELEFDSNGRFVKVD